MYFALLKKRTSRRNEKKNKTNKQTNQIKKKRPKQIEAASNRNNFKQNKLRSTWELGIALLHDYPQINNRSMILPGTVVISCSVDVSPCVVTTFVPVDVPVGLVLVRTGWTKQIP